MNAKSSNQEKDNSFTVAVIRALLAKGLIDKNKLNDKAYVIEAINKNSQILNEMNVLLEMHEEFIESAREAITADKLEVAVVLIATAIEQIINLFYREVLEEDQRFTPEEITEIIRSNNISAKISWLLVLVADFDIIIAADDLQKDIFKIIELRNQIIHYKAISFSISKGNPINHRIQEYGLDKMLDIPNQLSNILNEVALHNVRVNDPEYLAILKAFDSLED